MVLLFIVSLVKTMFTRFFSGAPIESYVFLPIMTALDLLASDVVVVSSRKYFISVLFFHGSAPFLPMALLDMCIAAIISNIMYKYSRFVFLYGFHCVYYV